MAAAVMPKSQKMAIFDNGSSDRHEIWHGDAHLLSEP